MILTTIERTRDCTTFLIESFGSTMGTLTSFKNKFIVHLFHDECNTLITFDDFNEAIVYINDYVLEVIEND